MNAQPIKVELEIDLNQVLGTNSIRYDDEGTPVSEPTTIEDLILHMAATKIADRAVASGGEGIGWSDLRRRVGAIRDDTLRKLLKPMLTEAVNSSLRATNAYGEPTGDEMTVREYIVRLAREQLQVRGTQNHLGTKQQATLLQIIIAEELDAAFRKEIAGLVAGAKADVVDSVRETASQILAEEILKKARS